MKRNYYIYAYLNPLKEGIFEYKKYKFMYEPFYIGKGIGKRMYYHLNINNKSNPFKTNIIKKIYENNKHPIIIKIKENLSEKSSYKLEKYIIKLMGRRDLNKGPLTNLNDGGIGGFSGYIFTEKQRKKMGEIKKKIYKGKGNPFFGKRHTLKTKQIISKVHKNTILSESHRNKIIKYLKIFKSGKNNPMFDHHGNKHHASKKYKIIDPNNKIYIIEGTIGYTLKNFCKQFNISHIVLHKGLIYNKNPTTKGRTKGWKLEYYEN